MCGNGVIFHLDLAGLWKWCNISLGLGWCVEVV